ncbi:MAG: biopolymer transporter ExbD [Flavitalea sp.]
MPKVKVPRKSTSVDMTAMCDVAFLLLSFFILTTKFKPAEALAVVTPKSVSTNPAEQKNVVLITMDSKGAVYFSVSDDAMEEKDAVINEVDKQRALGLSDAEKKNFRRSGAYVGVPFNQLKSFLQKTPEEIAKLQITGIPVTDTLNNELQVWIRAAQTAFRGTKMTILLKGDNDAKYPSFKGILDALKKNELFKFQMITDPEGVPPGTDLYKRTTGPRAAAPEQ